MSSHPKPFQKTFRVKGHTALAQHTSDGKDSQGGLGEATVRRRSLGSALSHSTLIRNGRKRLRLSFANVPSCLSGGIDQDEWRFPLPRLDSPQNSDERDEDVVRREVELVIDTHYRGLTPLRFLQGGLGSQDRVLNLPTKRQNLRLTFGSYVAISGLGGHAFGSFKERGGPLMWLCDSLPHRLPGVRILLSGYDTTLSGSQSFRTLNDLAGQFRTNIRVLSGNQRPRPLIIIAHSLGGLIVKQALIQMHDGDDLDKAYLMQHMARFSSACRAKEWTSHHWCPWLEISPIGTFWRLLVKNRR